MYLKRGNELDLELCMKDAKAFEKSVIFSNEREEQRCLKEGEKKRSL